MIHKPLTILLLLVLPIFSSLYGQDLKLNIDGTISEGKSKLSGVDVILKKGSSVVAQTTTAGNGSFKMSMALDDEYVIYFQKSGYTTKKIRINTKDVPEEERKYGDFNFPRWTVELYKKDLNVDYSALSNPVGVVLFLPYNGNFGIDPEYAAEVRAELDRIEASVAEAIQAKKDEELQLEADYKQAIKDGDNFVKSKEYENALDQYEAAINLKPDETYAKSQIEKVNSLLTAQKDLEKNYSEFLKKADNALDSKQWDAAKENYKQALGLKPKETYPKEQLVKVDKLRKEAEAAELKEAYDKLIAQADAEFKADKLEEAKALYQEAQGKLPKEAYPKQKISEIDKTLASRAKMDQQYQKAIEKADGLLASEKWPEAKAGYEAALTIKKEESYPKEKIAEIEKLIAAKKAEEEAAKKAEEERLAKLKAEYDKLIADADGAFGKGEFEAAKGLYQQAQEKQPEESYPKGKIKECDAKLGELAKKDEQYQKAVAKADELLAAEKFDEAKSGYEAALAIKEDAYPKGKIAEIEKLVAAKKAEEEAAKKAEEERLAKLKAEYDKLIADADGAFGKGEFETAKGLYQQAQEKQPDESYPKDKIKECDSKLGDLAKQEEKYQDAIAKADELLAAEKLAEAKSGYEAALAIKEDAYPKGKIAEIEKLVAAKKAEEEAAKKAEEERLAKLKAEYDKLVADADGAFGKGEFEAAKGLYQQAQEKQPDESYPKDKIKECDSKLGDLAKQEEKYQDAIAKADELLAAEKLAEAKSGYEAALAIKEDAYPKGKIAEIEKLVAAKKAEEEAAKKAEEERLAKLKAEYDKLIADADGAFGKGEFEAAKGLYQQAQEKQPDESYPKDKIKECDSKLGDLAKQEEKYQDAIAKADELLAAEKLAEAKSGYEAALAIKEDAYPKGKITEIDAKIAEAEKAAEDAKKAEEERLAKLKAEYDKLIADADGAFGKGEFETAKGLYQQAQEKQPDEDYPKDKIKECDSKLGDMAKQDEKYQKAIAKADELFGAEKLEDAKSAYQEALSIKEDDYPKGKIAEIDAEIAEAAKAKENEAKAEEERLAKLKAEYDKLIADADGAFNKGEFESAKGLYQQAQEKQPDESYPKDQIKECDSKLGGLAKQEEKYQKAIAKADELFGAEKLEDAKSAYQEALSIKEDAYPKGKIAEIDAKFADAAKAKENEAKAEEERLAKLKAAYDKLIADADGAFNKGEFETAKGLYQQAQEKQPDESYPKDQIKECDSKLGGLAKQEEKYQKAIAKADELFGAEKLEDAKSAYQEALAIKEDAYPKGKIAEIDAKFADAAKAKENEAKAEEERLAKLKAEYDKLIADADGAFNKGEFESAKGLYQQAQEKQPDESYPKDRIKECESKLGGLAKQEEKYQKAIAKADELFAAEKLEDAKSRYQEALSIKEDTYPKGKIAEIDGKLDEVAAATASAEKDAEYQKAIEKADKLFGDEKWEDAKSAYQNALAVKEEAYPKEKIAEIDRLLKEKQAALAAAETDKQYQDAIKNADKLFSSESYNEAKSAYQSALAIKEDAYPKGKIAEIDNLLADKASRKEAEKKNEEYKTLIAQADKLFKKKNYEDARQTYSEAIELNSSEQYPKDQIDKIEQLVEELAAAAERNKANEAAEKKAKYEALIAEGDQALSGKDFDTAKDRYKQAKKVMPDEAYPDQKLREIDDMIAAIASVDDQFKQTVDKADKLYKSEDLQAALDAYKKAQSIKPSENYPQKKIDEINEKLLASKEELRRKEEAVAAKKAEVKAKYDEAIAAADNAFNSKSYPKAKGLYQKAQKILPSESYPSDQLAEIDKLVSGNARAEKEYKSLIAVGDRMILLKDYESAIAKFEEASKLKPSESYPKERIDYVKDIQKNLSASEVAKLDKMNARKKVKDEQYDDLIAKADVALDKKHFSEAKNLYFKAREIKPREAYPMLQIEEVNKGVKAFLAEQQKRKEEEALKKRKQDEYNKLIAEGDHFYENGNYQTAIKSFKEAANSELADNYPQKRVDEIEAEVEKKREEAKELAEKRKEKEKQRIEFIKWVRSGNAYLGAKDYENAISSFEFALEIFPEDRDIANKLKSAENLLKKEQDEIAERNRLAEEKKRKAEEYKNYVKKADELYMRRKYEEALAQYKSALDVMPNQSHAKMRVNKINVKLAEMARKEKMKVVEQPEKISALAKKYPQGVTEKITEEGNKKVTRIIIVDGNKGDEYNMIEYSFGKVYYLKNGKPYNAKSWKSETGK